ncbi:uncharacterized protein LOC113850992 [Abrus precatorius]|uniref:Uncharacterized protein LOC113850992 n=1 Tax=Abrus precatorius TaxID=3816 RepID=A0A8B8K0J1_ABRPR|nr:uncharacterized protein LOC113850992 [Abrus precatorius]
MSGAKASQSEELIRGKCIIKGRLLDVLFDLGATHSFISVDCVKSLNLEFEVDLICLPLSQLDVILGMDWLAANHVLLDCREKTLIFGATVAEVPRLMSQGAWENMVNAKAFMIMFSMEAECVVEPEYIPIVKDFLEFTIDLILGASPISVAPYRMSPVELVEVKKQVEDLLQK